MASEFPDGKFPFGKQKREKQIEFSRDVTAFTRLKEAEGTIEKVFAVYDSPLDGGPGSDSNFEDTFRYVVPPGVGSLRSDVEGSLEKKKGKAIGIEYGGPGSALFAGFSKGFFEKTLGVTLTDIRGSLSPDPTPADEKRHHFVLEGDMTSLQTRKNVHDWLGDKKVDFIVERLAGGRLLLPEEPYLISDMFNDWYQTLGEDGIIYAQTSKWMRPLLKPWKKMIDAQYSETLELRYVHDSTSRDVFDAIRLRKLHGAPETLPLLDPRAVRRISRQGK